MTKRSTKSQPKLRARTTGPKMCGRIETDREMTKEGAKELLPLFKEAEAGNWTKEQAKYVRFIYSRAGEPTPVWLVGLHGLKAKAPGSKADKTDRYLVFGCWVKSDKKSLRLAKFIKAQSGADWETLSTEQQSLWLKRLNRVLKTYNAAIKLAKNGGPAVPADIQASMAWDTPADESQEEDLDEDMENEEDDEPQANPLVSP